MPRRRRLVVHVNQYIIRANKVHGHRDPPITVRWGRSVTRTGQVVIYGADGTPAATVVYRPDAPLACGARVWIEVLGEADVEVAAECLERVGSPPRLADEGPTASSSDEP
jgi:hypothetical protein